MRYSFITQNQSNERLIAVFLGWAMDDSPFRGLRRDGFDIVVFYGYGESETWAKVYRGVTGRYREVSVVAWSFGVAVADRLITRAERQCIAVNGTPVPVDDANGIPRHVFAITLRMMSEANLAKFYESTGFSKGMTLPQRDLADVRDELAMFGSLPRQEASRRWQVAHIAQDDRIIAAGNQRNYWTGRCRVVSDQTGHLPDLQSVIDNDIVDKQLIARRFSNNAGSYEANATVQRDIAVRLMERVRRHFSIRGKRIFEAGSGTGFLTRLYAPDCPSAESVAADLADRDTLCEVFRKKGIDYCGKLVSGDAEQLMADADSATFDGVFSSSTIQWFSDPRRFMANVARVLVPGGVAAFSTFLPGTFAELQAASGRTLHFMPAEEFSDMVPDCMERVESHSESVTVRFENGRELMRHVKLTGVNAVGPSTGYGQTRRVLAALDENPKLTYNIFYIILKKKA